MKPNNYVKKYIRAKCAHCKYTVVMDSRFSREFEGQDMSFDLFNLGVIIGDMFGQCENENIPIDTRLPYQMKTAHKGKIIHCTADKKYNVTTCLYIVLYSYTISLHGDILASGKDLSNYELVKAIYKYFTYGE